MRPRATVKIALGKKETANREAESAHKGSDWNDVIH
jgi:hypothetical protein